MGLNKLHFDFELTENGWEALPLTEEDAYRGTVGTKVVLRVTEYTHDEKPDIWYKPHILSLCDAIEEKTIALSWLKKYGMPPLMSKLCWSEVADIELLVSNDLAGK